MPRPLSTLTPDEQRLYGLLAGDPLDTVTPLGLADAAEDQGLQERADLIREHSRLLLLELLRGAALTEDEAGAVASRIRTLLAAGPKPNAAQAAAATERELSAGLGAPQRGNAMLQLLDPDGNLDRERLREQYDFQVNLLASLDLLSQQEGRLGIAGIDNTFYPLPSFAAIPKRLRISELLHKVAQGFDQLLLVPFALPLSRLLDAWRQDLLRNEHMLPHGINREQPMWLLEACSTQAGRGPDEDGRLLYFPEYLSRNHSSRTKAQLLAANPSAGWQVLLTEGALTELPRRGQGQTLAGRRQIEAGRTPRQYLASLPKGEVDWTPEAYIVASLTTLERSGALLDTETGSYLTASYLPTSRGVPHVFWYPEGRRANFGRSDPGMQRPNEGARAAVRVI